MAQTPGHIVRAVRWLTDLRRIESILSAIIFITVVYIFIRMRLG